ncbi:crAss001_48 related protein [Streptococcus minor]
MEDYQKRVIEEYKQLKTRFIRLKNFIKEYDKGNTQDWDLQYPIEVLKMQCHAMQVYCQILEFRAKLDGIDLNPKKRYTVAIPVGNGFYKTLVQHSKTGNLVLGDYNYASLKLLEKHNRNVPDGGITEDRIKKSSCSWAWQFAKELTDD